MRTSDERLRLIRGRTAELRAERRRRRRRAVDGACVAACLALVVVLGVCMPGWTEGAVTAVVEPASGAASLVASNAALGYVMMGLLCFLLGVCVTMLLMRLHRRDRRQPHHVEDDDDEL